MTKKILGLVGSYRKVGNSEIVAKEVAARMGSGYELELVRMPNISIQPCKGCYACLLPGKDCNLKDDVNWLKDKILNSDACIVAAPDYVLGPVGIMKMLADRALQFYDSLEPLGKIPTAAALTLGREDFRGYADAALLAMVRSIGLDCRGIELFHGTHPGEIAADSTFNKKIENLVRALTLTEESPSWGRDRCSNCGSDLFRAREGKIFCSLCESEAVFSNGTFSITSATNKLEAEGQHEHLLWLTDKKLEYSGKREELKKIQDRYRSGDWTTPDDK